VRTEIEQPGGEQPAGHQHEGARNGRRHETQAENHGKRGRADHDGRPVHVAQRLEPGRKLVPGAVSLGGGSGQLRQLSDDHIDGSAGQESSDHRSREELGDPTHAQKSEQQEQDPGRDRDRRHQLRGVVTTDAGGENGTSRHGRK
jgi:hypothetical protein